MSFAAAGNEASDMAEVRRVVASADSSFAAGMHILPTQRRRAIHAVYALCRAVDDIVDGDAPGSGYAASRAHELDRWETEIAAIYNDTPRTAIGTEIARVRGWLELPQGEFALILDGMRMDAAGIVAPDGPHLTAYIRRVAGSVGILSMRCFGAWAGATSERFALNLAHGLQLINILRDVEDDAAVGRLYIPADILARAGIPASPAAAARHPNLPLARAALGREARLAFSRAAAEVPAHRRLPLLPALMMMGPYERLLTRWERDWSRPAPRRSGAGKLLDAVTTVARPIK